MTFCEMENIALKIEPYRQQREITEVKVKYILDAGDSYFKMKCEEEHKYNNSVSAVDEIINNVYNSMLELNPQIEYRVVRHRVMDYLSKNTDFVV